MKDDLADNDFYGAFTTFIKQCGKFIKQADGGEPFDVYNKIKTPSYYIKIAVIAAIAGLILAIAVTFILKGQLKSVRPQHNANSYVRNGSVRITGGREIFLYKSISRLKKKQFLQTAEEAVPIQALPVLLTEEAPANFKIYENKKRYLYFYINAEKCA